MNTQYSQHRLCMLERPNGECDRILRAEEREFSCCVYGAVGTNNNCDLQELTFWAKTNQTSATFCRLSATSYEQEQIELISRKMV